MSLTSVPATKLIPAEIRTDVATEQLLKKVVDGAIFVSDVLVGSGEAVPPGTRETRFEDFKRHGVLGYATTAATAGAQLIGTGLAVGATAFSPLNWLNPVQWSVSLLNPAYWLSTAQFGEETWGKLAAGPVACVSSALLGTARAPGAKLRELEDENFPDIVETTPATEPPITKTDIATQRETAEPAVA